LSATKDECLRGEGPRASERRGALAELPPPYAKPTNGRCTGKLPYMLRWVDGLFGAARVR
jgi:hypothetical protein